MTALAKQKYTVEEYIEILKNSDERFEYFDGEIFSMASGKVVHEDIVSNLIYSLRDKLKDRDCRVAGGNLAVKTVKAPPFRLPDVSVVCGKRVIEEIHGFQMLVNPTLLIEVLSSSTAEFDREGKFLIYQAIESFREYLLVEQGRPHVTRYIRQDNGGWLRYDVIGTESEVLLESVGVPIQLSEIYSMIEFPQAGIADYPNPPKDVS